MNRGIIMSTNKEAVKQLRENSILIEKLMTENEGLKKEHINLMAKAIHKVLTAYRKG